MNSAQEIADGIVQLLEKRGQLAMLPQIIEVLQAHSAGISRYNVAIIRTAVALQNDEREMLKQQLSQMFGRQLQIDEQVDESIVGGMFIQVGDTVLDYTLSSSLKQIGEHLEK
jgi:F-type H+-transporting ATPase subunit delta